MRLNYYLTSSTTLSYITKHVNYYYFNKSKSKLPPLINYVTLNQLCIIILPITTIFLYYFHHTIYHFFIINLYNNNLYYVCLLSNRLDLYNFPFILLLKNYIIQSINIEYDTLPFYIRLSFNLNYNVFLSILNMKSFHLLISPFSFTKLGLYYIHSLF